ncbi:MAG TPA: carboxy terminal-processing peptidase, partial [Opitutales bacterium]|nr:carboxy terminal-processing peptidase [Opitutales bacterium]
MAARFISFHAGRIAGSGRVLFTALALLLAANSAYSQKSEGTAATSTAATPSSAVQTPARDEFRITRELSNRFREETRLVLAYMSSRHYGSTSIDEIDSRELISAYMKELDYSKIFFTQSDQNDIETRFAASLKGEYLMKGNLYPAFEIFSLYRQRARDRLAWVFKRLNRDFDYSVEETYRLDRHDLVWPANQLEADQLWERRLKFEMLDGIINGEESAQTRDRLVHRYQRIERALAEMEPYEVEEMFLNSFTELFDPHSNFMSVEAAENFSIAISNSLQGIGAILSSEDGYCIIQELIPGGPAELSGQVNPGDKIVAVAQGAEDPLDVVDMKLSKVVKLIRGTKGSEVRLTIVPANNPSARTVVRIIRDEIRLTEQLASARLVQVPSGDGTGLIPVGVIDLPSFYGADPDDGPDAPTTTRDVQELLIRLKALGAKAIVLDLRRNGGGLLSEAIRLTGLFIKDGPVVQVRYENGKIRADFDDDGGLVTYSGPLVVLVSRSSASASEICAGALQVLHRGIIVGDRTTHGKGTVQQTIPLNSMRQSINPFGDPMELGMLKITIQKFYLPDGASTQERGVTSDIVIPSISEFLPIGETDLEHYLPWDSIPPATWDRSGVIASGGAEATPGALTYLSGLSEKRMSSLPEFDFLARSIAHFRDIDNRKDISVCENIRRSERDEAK